MSKQTAPKLDDADHLQARLHEEAARRMNAEVALTLLRHAPQLAAEMAAHNEVLVAFRSHLEREYGCTVADINTQTGAIKRPEPPAPT